MTQRQAIRHLGSYLLRREWIGIVVTFLFALYTGGFMSFSVNGLMSDEKIPEFLNGLVDWIYLTMFPTFGLLMNKTVFAVWKGDVYSKRIAHWLTMPIPRSAIVKVRILQTVIMLPVIGIAFLLFQYILAPELRADISVLQWLGAGLIWMCYAFVIDALYTLFEFGFDGKRNVVFCMAFMVFTVALSVVLTWRDVHLFQAAIRAAGSEIYPLLTVLLVTTSFMATWIGYRATLIRLNKRSLNF
ncbi:hypothetical protein SD71_02360 [Cohnella kolymensis]|uniref:ABC transporter permease n=1 Tax=Cohnella kolymensis TaxID=1590652 RepID=A0ABR5A8V9_9BACL|nr:hypothetical protein [Cohnella kolymensis]KIL37496.1 hypothetical protein SD71_02360 [Cohnella kolymensis]